MKTAIVILVFVLFPFLSYGAGELNHKDVGATITKAEWETSPHVIDGGTTGSMIYQTGGELVGLTIGAAGRVLSVVGGVPAWVATSGLTVGEAANSLLLGGHTPGWYLSADNIGSGTLAYARLPVGAGATQVAQGSHLHTGVYEPTLGTGTTSQYLRGDKQWATVTSGPAAATGQTDKVMAAADAAGNLRGTSMTITTAGAASMPSGSSFTIGDAGTAMTGLVAQWKLNDNAESPTVLDATENYDGEMIDGVDDLTRDHAVAGKIGGALSFDGSDDYVQIPQASVSGQTGTFAAWIYPNYTSSEPAIFGAYQEYGLTGLNIAKTTDGHLRMYYSFGTAETQYGVRTTNSVPDSAWTHVAVTTNGSTWKLFLNGMEESLVVTHGTNNGGWFGDVDPYSGTIGIVVVSYTTLYSPWDGKLDDIRIYNRALTATEILALYNEGNGTEETPASYGLSVATDGFFGGTLVVKDLLQWSDMETVKVSAPLDVDFRSDLGDAVATYYFRDDLVTTETITRENVPITADDGSSNTITTTWPMDVATTTKTLPAVPPTLGFNSRLLPDDLTRDVNGVRCINLESIAAYQAKQISDMQAKIEELTARIEALEARP